MKVGDLIKHKRSDSLALVVRLRWVATYDRASHPYIDLVWLDDGTRDHAYSGLFEVLSENR